MLFAVQRSRESRVSCGFTLIEVVVATAILAVIAHGLIYGYISSSQRAEWSAHSLAAQSLAAQGIEQARAAKWDPQAWPIVDELPPQIYLEVETLDLPVIAGAEPQFATNYISVTTVSDNPPLREIRAACVWRFANGGLFTNTQVTLRAPDQ